MGSRSLKGAPARIVDDPAVIEAYLGSGERRCSGLRTCPLPTVRSSRCARAQSRCRAAASSRWLGANGAGKTTALHAITGFARALVRGTITWEGRFDRGAGARPASWRAGISLVPEHRQLFPDMTVEEKPGDGLLRPWSECTGSDRDRAGVHAVSGGLAEQNARRMPAMLSGWPAAECWRSAARLMALAAPAAARRAEPRASRR